MTENPAPIPAPAREAAPPPEAAFRPETIHAALGPDFHDIVTPARFPAALLRYRNARWAARCGLGSLDDARWIAHFARFEPLPGSFEAPLALRYHGHQFRAYNPDLGDGRGFLFAQLRDDRDRLLDLGTKGSGQTPYSRRGDGRLTLKGGVREVLATAMLEALGVETSKSFSLVETGESLLRSDEPSPTRASVLVRLSHSHLRIGTFQRLLARNDAEGMARLLAHAVTHYLPEARRDTMAGEAAAFLGTVAARVARMTAQWTAAGFVHGVLNTDNVNITGESFDYGPYRFLPHYEPGFTAAYFDETGLYAFARQPEAMAWNLARLAECLLLLAPVEALEPALARFPDLFRAELRAAFRRRLALAPAGEAAGEALVGALLAFLHATKAPFEAVMFDLHRGAARLQRALSGPRAGFYARAEFAPLRAAIEEHPPASPAPASDYFEREHPVTLLYGEIEALWTPIAERDDWDAFTAKLAEIEGLRTALAADFSTPEGSAGTENALASRDGESGTGGTE